MTVEKHTALTALDDRLAFTPAGHQVEELRRVKDEDEIALLREACAISDRALAGVLPSLRAGLTEREVAIALERAMIDLGADAIAFDTIVASGPNGAIPHHRPGDRVLERGDLVTIDFGALMGGYHADMTRTIAIGTPAGWQRDLYDLVLRAQLAGIGAAAPGADTKDVDAAARDVIVAAGHGGDFPHGLGHGVGLEIHEAPLMGYDKTGKLADRVPITAEPGVYLAGRGGIRIEDTLVVRADGPELLTETTKDLLVL
jgi:Xaa-Pro aminopeptidase